MRLRPYRPSDLADVQRLELEVYGSSAWSPAMVAEELAAPARHYVVVEDERGGEIHGYAGIALGETAQVMTIALRASDRGCGIGRAMFADLLAAASDAGADEVILEVRVDNEAAIALYASFGFEIIGRRPRYYQPEDVDAYVMKTTFAAASVD